jgi:hypothetical protein
MLDVLPAQKATLEQVKHCLRPYHELRKARSEGVVKISRQDVFLHELYNAVKEYGGLKAVQVRDSSPFS